MTSVIPEASTATPDPREQRAAETGDQHTPTALYRLHGADGTLLYIGVSDNPERRFKQHRDSKPWWPQVARKTLEWHPSRARALAEEAAAIKAETPAYNIDHNPAARQNEEPSQWPPAGMPADMVDTVQRVTETLPSRLAEDVQRAASEGFTQRRLDSDPGVVARAWDAIDDVFAASTNAELTRQGLRGYVDMIADKNTTPTEAFEALVAEYDLQVEELDETILDEKHRGKVYAFYVETGDQKILCLPAGQDPAHQLAAVRALLAHPGVIA